MQNFLFFVFSKFYFVSLPQTISAMWIEDLYRSSERLVAEVTTDYTRSIYARVKWNARMVCLKGARGVGKTTMMLQRMKAVHTQEMDAIYVTLDDLSFADHRLSELVEYHHQHGGRYMFLDEVHRYPSQNWALELKNVYDKYPRMNVAFSGSSVLDIDAKKADLSRRCLFYDVPGLSFREYLELEGLGRFPACALDDILHHHQDIEREVIPHLRVIAAFEKYLATGYYPIYKEADSDYGMQLRQMVSTIIETDLPAAYKLEYATLIKLKHLMAIIAHTVPFTINVDNLSKHVEASRKTVMKMFDLLSKARLINLLYSGRTTFQQMVKPEKIYLENPNLMYALSPSDVAIGTVRESFFANQLSYGHTIAFSDSGDFLIDNQYTIEVGGKSKSFSQIKDMPDSYLALGDIEYGHLNKIPLWLFGFLY